MPADTEATFVIPHQLCFWCDRVLTELRPFFSTTLKHDRLIEHYPSMQMFINSVLQQPQCQLCAMFVASLVERCGLETGVEEALDKLREYRGKEADRPLLTAMENLGWVPSGCEMAHCLALKYYTDGRTLETVACVRLLHFKGGTSVSSASTTSVE